MTNARTIVCLALLLFLATSVCSHAQTWSFTGSMAQQRIYPTATLLPNGQVLIVGGYHRGTGGIAQAELYNPTTGTFTTTGSLTTGRYSASATLLNNGKVLIAGGQNTSGRLASTELYDPASGTFTASGSLSCACGFVPTLLPNGMVLFSGGFDSTSGRALATAELYNPSTGTFSPTGSLKVARAGPSSTLLPNGKVLVAGGVVHRHSTVQPRRKLSCERRAIRPIERHIFFNRKPEYRPVRAVGDRTRQWNCLAGRGAE